MTRQVRIGIAGAAGRMGRMLIRQVMTSKDAILAQILARPGSDWIGQDAGRLLDGPDLGVRIDDDPASVLAACDVAIDFSARDVTAELARLAPASGTALVVGTTGLTTEHQAALDAAARHVAIVQAPNMSVGVVLLTALVEQVAAILGPDYDVEVLEMHHRDKIDAPSGTALALGEAAARGRGVTLDDAAVRARDGMTGPRNAGSIGFAALRGGDVVGDHTVMFAGPGERIELCHKAASRAIYARGAVRAALWCSGRPAGRYTMRDMLGL